jgi:hypothetical protein
MTPRRESANKHMLRAGTHKVLGRGRSEVLLSQVPRARVLMRPRAGAVVGRWAALTYRWVLRAR